MSKVFSFRLAESASEQIARLMEIHGAFNQGALIQKALDCLESQPAPVSLDSRVLALETQLTALEQRLNECCGLVNNNKSPAIKKRQQGDLAPLQAPLFDSDAECWRWAYDQYMAGYSLRDVNAALPEQFRKRNPSRDFKKEWINFGIDERGGGGGGDELQNELAVKSQDNFDNGN